MSIFTDTESLFREAVDAAKGARERKTAARTQERAIDLTKAFMSDQTQRQSKGSGLSFHETSEPEMLLNSKTNKMEPTGEYTKKGIVFDSRTGRTYDPKEINAGAGEDEATVDVGGIGKARNLPLNLQGNEQRAMEIYGMGPAGARPGMRPTGGAMGAGTPASDIAAIYTMMHQMLSNPQQNTLPLGPNGALPMQLDPSTGTWQQAGYRQTSGAPQAPQAESWRNWEAPAAPAAAAPGALPVVKNMEPMPPGYVPPKGNENAMADLLPQPVAGTSRATAQVQAAKPAPAKRAAPVPVPVPAPAQATGSLFGLPVAGALGTGAEAFKALPVFQKREDLPLAGIGF